MRDRAAADRTSSPSVGEPQLVEATFLPPILHLRFARPRILSRKSERKGNSPIHIRVRVAHGRPYSIMTADSQNDAPSRPHARLIAIVDDDHRMLESLENLLQSSGYRTLLYLSAEAFLHSPEGKNVDFLISDVGLPSMNGIELLKTIRRERQMLPAVLITARTESHYEENARELGVVLFAKPFDSNELLRTIERQLGA